MVLGFGIKAWGLKLFNKNLDKKKKNGNAYKLYMILIFPVYYCLKKYNLMSFVSHIVSIIFC